MSLPLLVSAVFGLPGGVVVGQLGHVRSFGIGWFLIALVTASAIAPNFPTLLVLRLFYGLSFAFVITVTGPILIHWFSNREVLVMNGLNTAILSAGIAVSVPTSALLANEVGWQNAMGVFGAIGLLGTVAWVAFGRGSGAAAPQSALVPVREILRVIRSRPIVLLLAADAGVLVQYTALTAWLPTFYAEARGMTAEQAGFVTGLLPFVGIFAVLLGGFLPLRVGTPRVYFIIPGLMIAVGGPGSFMLGDPDRHLRVPCGGEHRLVALRPDVAVALDGGGGDGPRLRRHRMGIVHDLLRLWNVHLSHHRGRGERHIRQLHARVRHLRRCKFDPAHGRGSHGQVPRPFAGVTSVLD